MFKSARIDLKRIATSSVLQQLQKAKKMLTSLRWMHIYMVTPVMVLELFPDGDKTPFFSTFASTISFHFIIFPSLLFLLRCCSYLRDCRRSVFWSVSHAGIRLTPVAVSLFCVYGRVASWGSWRALRSRQIARRFTFCFVCFVWIGLFGLFV